LRVGLRLDTYKLEVLKIGSLIAGWFQAQQSELCGDVLGSQIAAARSGGPAFQQIATFLTKDLAIPPDKPLDVPVN